MEVDEYELFLPKLRADLQNAGLGANTAERGTSHQTHNIMNHGNNKKFGTSAHRE